MTFHDRALPTLSGCRVLVAEDDPFIAAELGELLAECGAEIMGPVPTVPAALAAIEAQTPDAAVLDVNLRNSSSAPIAQALQSLTVPLVLVTGYTRELLSEESLRDAPLLPKPVRTAELLDVLGRLLRVRRRGADDLPPRPRYTAVEADARVASLQARR